MGNRITELEVELDELRERDDLAVDCIKITPPSTPILEVSGFELADKQTWEDDELRIGNFWGEPVFLIYDRIEEGYIIETTELYRKCKKCSNRKMYDETHGAYYCPVCDNMRSKFKDKVFNLLR